MYYTYNKEIIFIQHKLTITVDEKVYKGLHKVIGRGNISRFLEDLARPYVSSEKGKAVNGISLRKSGEKKGKEALLKLCDELAQTAKRNGMTAEILQSILNSED